MSQIPSKQTIGRAEVVSLPEQNMDAVNARIDTGARTSAIWVSHASVEDGRLAVVFLGKEHPLYTGKKIYFDIYSQDIVTNSTGHREKRYKIKLLVIIAGRRIRASFTLADRSTQVYPILIGRNVLRGKFIVDVKIGNVLAPKEKQLLKKNKAELQEGVK